MSYFYKPVINGLLPKDWRLVSISEIADVRAGGTPSTKNPIYWGGDIPWMNSGEINLRRIKQVEGRITELGLNNSSTRLMPANSVLMALAGQGKTRGKVAVNEFSLCTNQSLASIYNFDNADYEFIFQNLESRYSEIRKMSTGDGGRGGLNLRIINSIKIGLPPLPEQQKIAEILSTVDAKIEVIDQQITETQELKKGLMQRLLTKGIGHTEFKDSPLGKIPKSWEVDELELIGIELIDGDRGHNYPKSKDFSNEGYCLFLSAKNVTKKGFKFDECQFISENRDNLLRKGKLSRNDFVITTRGSVGHIAFYDDSIPYEHVRLNSGMVILRDSKRIFNTKFLYQLMKSPVFEVQIEFITSGSAQPQLTIKGLKKLKLPIPPIKEQLVIGDMLSTISSKLEILAEKKNHYLELKQGLMQQLLTGKVRVKLKTTATA